MRPWNSVGAPSIQPTDLTSYKNEKVIKTNDYFYQDMKK